MKYTVILEPQEEGGYAIQCIEIPGAISQGETKEEAVENIKEAIALMLDTIQEDISVNHREIMQVSVSA